MMSKNVGNNVVMMWKCLDDVVAKANIEICNLFCLWNQKVLHLQYYWHYSTVLLIIKGHFKDSF